MPASWCHGCGPVQCCWQCRLLREPPKMTSTVTQLINVCTVQSGSKHDFIFFPPNLLMKYVSYMLSMRLALQNLQVGRGGKKKETKNNKKDSKIIISIKNGRLKLKLSVFVQTVTIEILFYFVLLLAFFFFFPRGKGC